jgi:hypothetical protein
VRDRGIFSNYTYPSYITDEILKLLGNVVVARQVPISMMQYRSLRMSCGDTVTKVSGQRIEGYPGPPIFVAIPVYYIT